MNATARNFLTRITALFVAALFAAMAGGCATAQSQPRGWSRAELDQLLAPVALYPDALLAQVLIAATYPDEVVVAARWSRMHPELDGENAVRAADAFDWDPSVKSLLAFPGLLDRMDANIDWTRELGDAFLAQEQDVIDTVQGLRRRARVAGALASDGHVHVTEDGPRIAIAFASPALVYLPYYDPRVVYGRWWWPAHPPVVWAPWPGYRFYPRASGISVGFWWSSGVRLSIGFFYGGIDWPRREVRVVRVDTWYVHRAMERHAPHRVVAIKPGRWHHEPTRRHAGARPRPHAPQAAPRPAPPREARRPEVRQSEARQHDARRLEQRRPEPRQPEVRERSPSTMPQGSRRDARRLEVRRPEATRPEERRPEPRQAEARERPTSTVQAAPGRDARRPDVRRPEAHRPQAGRVQRDASARTAQREAQRPPPAREAPRPQAQPETERTESRPEAQPRPRPQHTQPAERAGPRSGPERGPRNADDARERRPQG
jgi:hypothetical protein